MNRATSGAEGIRMAQQEQPDVIFLDLMMPAMDGFSVVRALKGAAATREKSLDRAALGTTWPELRFRPRILALRQGRASRPSGRTRAEFTRPVSLEG